MDVANHAAADGDTLVLFDNLVCNRLFWTLNGPLESTIQVMPDQWYDPDAVMEPYFCPPATPGAEPSWHPISLEPLTTPTSSTITVEPYCIEAWEDLWRDLHWQSFPDTEEGQTAYANCYGSDAERYGEYPWANEDNFYVDHVLVECCGMQRPQSKDAKLQVYSS
ncbi:hypothetical protein PspLS_09892 [Pyricularia sp. CBS 133598]|nr:hypothetical protein PspLS_09892 [Pyricularia sp. CBS 133598]